GEQDEIHRVLVGTDRSRLDARTGGQLVLLLLGANQISDAQIVLRDLLARSPDDPGTLDLAARVAERQGRLDEAASFAERVLEREGRFADADRRWQQAIAAEPTNPTWLISRAHNLLTTGDTTTARTLADQVKAGKWQDRFSNAEYEAKELLRQLDAMKR